MNITRKAGTAASLFKFWLNAGSNGHRESPESVLDLTFRYRGVAPIQRRSELLEFAKIVEKLRPKRVLEIGTCNGGTLLVFCRLADERAHLYSIDLQGGRFGGGYDLFRVPVIRRMKKTEQQLHLLRANSHEKKTRLALDEALGGARLELLFIDGDHTYEGVRSDFEMYAPLVAPGGIIAFHDIVSGREDLVGEVQRFWAEVKAGYKYQEIIEDPRQAWGGIGVLFL